MKELLIKEKHTFYDKDVIKLMPTAVTENKRNLRVNMWHLEGCELVSLQVTQVLSALIVFGNMFLKRSYCYSW